MNETQKPFSCDPARVEAFLADALDAAEESTLVRHLDQCECCRELIQQAAADVATWNELESALKDEPYDSVLLGSASRTPDDVAAPVASSSVNHVLAILAPTDDPTMLGRLGPYEISGVVGAGGMGVVLKGHDHSLDRTVAIKVLAPHLASSGAAKKRFYREARAAAAVLHPNVIAIHSVSNDTTLPYLVMPYIRGASLQKRIDAEGPLPLANILRIGAQIAAGLAAAHAQGLVHRDIKPANVMLEDGVERVAITDFGLARAVDDATMTRSGVIAGTPQYMSPEQSRGEPVDPRSDLFSLGSVLYAMCTGRPPFRAESTYGVIRRITEDEPTPIREINPDIPEWLCPIIVKLMSKQPDTRFASANEVAALLEECLAHVQQPATVPLPASLPSQSKPLHRSSVSRPLLGVIAMLLAFGCALGVILWAGSDPPDITGKWHGEEWGEVVLEKNEANSYEGSYTETVGNKVGKLELRWSRIERRFKGKWREDKDRYGKISVRLVDGQIRGAWTTNKNSAIDPGTPELADLLWKRAATPRTVKLEGAVLDVSDDGWVEISIGQDDGIREGMRLRVFHDRIKRGVIEIKKLQAHRSMARIVGIAGEDAASQIRTGDQVVATIPSIDNTRSTLNENGSELRSEGDAVTASRRERISQGGKPLADAVRAFNEQFRDHPIGKDQPPLTIDEVVASIRWELNDDASLDHLTQTDLRQFSDIAEKKTVADGWQLAAATLLEGVEGTRFKAWQIRLILLPRDSNTVRHTHVIRQQLVCQLDTNGKPMPLPHHDLWRADDNATPLAAAIKDFNVSHHTLQDVRLTPLTEAEVVAAIRFWKSRRAEAPVSDREFAAFQNIADQRKLPPGAELEVVGDFQLADGMNYDVWSVRVVMPWNVKPGWTFAYEIRRQFIAVEGPQQNAAISWGPVVDGLQAGVRVEPPNKPYAAGQKVTPVFYYRNTSDDPVDFSTPLLMTDAYYDKIVVVDAYGKEIRVGRGSRAETPCGWGLVRLAPGALHEIRGEPIVLGDVRGSTLPVGMHLRPGLTATVRFLVPNFGSRGAEPLQPGELQTGELRTVVDVVDAAPASEEADEPGTRAHEGPEREPSPVKDGGNSSSADDRATTVRVKVFELYHQDVKSIVKIISQVVPQVEVGDPSLINANDTAKTITVVVPEVERGTLHVTAHAATNSIVASGLAQQLAVLEELVSHLDRPDKSAAGSHD